MVGAAVGVVVGAAVDGGALVVGADVAGAADDDGTDGAAVVGGAAVVDGMTGVGTAPGTAGIFPVSVNCGGNAPGAGASPRWNASRAVPEPMRPARAVVPRALRCRWSPPV